MHRARGEEPVTADEWLSLDDTIRAQWDDDVVPGDDAILRDCCQSIPMPRPYVAGGAPTSPPWYRTMFSWDAYFSNLALLAHRRLDLVKDAIENYLAMIDRFGYMPNGNQVPLATRSQVPLFPDSIARYLAASADGDLLERAYPRLVEEYRGYWLADHHRTPAGLATNRDLGDPNLDPRLAAEAETGLDFTSLFEGNVSNTVPVMTNCSLVRYAQVLAGMAANLGLRGHSSQWRAEAAQRAERIRELCWNSEAGFFYDYDYVAERHVRQASPTGYWPLWAGVATAEQARSCVDFLPRLLQPFGLVTTDTAAESPFGAALGNEGLQWMYPAGWPPLQIIATWGLERYGHVEPMRRIAMRYLEMVVRNFRHTGELYEKYNVIDGGIELPNARYGTLPLHGWTSASVVLIGRQLFFDQPIDDQVPEFAPPWSD
ncbi:hypothetical protein F1D05_00875 [Kribbella qitaiheensis]|uniref:Alpha,alpha-trehalase n=1 Tax=Kribbella qitaiheensis TaxID=1544730 RepID=A0A7G6WRU8_9ACTN|nr:trehalase family glycosidase [Kribbella qitaiheensis]QNE16713.1 hypothetical protein F1D05_00875 [Kribbella qitaiheensis]